jgi:hypothetical protein
MAVLCRALGLLERYAHFNPAMMGLPYDRKFIKAFRQLSFTYIFTCDIVYQIQGLARHRSPTVPGDTQQ